jgi:hypothetical protein
MLTALGVSKGQYWICRIYIYLTRNHTQEEEGEVQFSGKLVPIKKERSETPRALDNRTKRRGFLTVAILVLDSIPGLNGHEPLKVLP